MSKCDISIELEPGSVRCHAGGVVRGVVVVDVDADCKCNALTVALGWFTHGRGNRRADTVQTINLFTGEWRAGQRVSYPFEMRLPNGPLSYEGYYFNVDWGLRARADIPWALDPKCDQDILLVAGPETDEQGYLDNFDGLAGVAEKRDGNEGETSYGLLMASVPFLLMGPLFLVFGLFGGDEGVEITTVILGLLFCVGGVFMFFGALRNRVASMKLGEVRIDWPEHPVRPGEAVPLRLYMSATDNLNDIVATLICQETVVSGSGTNEIASYHNVFSVPIKLERHLDGPEQLRAEGVIELPKSAPPCFYARDNELSWYVVLHIDVAKWPDWTRLLYLDVRPGGAIAQLEGPNIKHGAANQVGDVAFVGSNFEDTDAW
ncbi:hypothetical protein [Bradymonas sediminis]|uniref:Uncharacterized protein n=1 Tax=Bradymonas sediminis TaxID=1548548 RepID=A0A2Z4FNW6_9DELT|nr:hypothetical protein [Bradymonas sediminis]AWV90643.1 hypothetical protein DN745_15455 [Bradymonas sediminis]TDP62354.1 hypothetical protein DFR33_11317 [Bradymonas sediminis]